MAGVVALDDACRLLLVRRREGGWTHPAGRVEFGETWAEAALREFSEETGGCVELHGVLGAYSDPATQIYQYPSEERVHFVGVAFRGTVLSLGTPNAAEILDMGWFHQTSLPAPIFTPARPIIMDAFTHVYERGPADDEAERDLPDSP